VDNLVVLNK